MALAQYYSKGSEPDDLSSTCQRPLFRYEDVAWVKKSEAEASEKGIKGQGKSLREQPVELMTSNIAGSTGFNIEQAHSLMLAVSA